MSKSVFSKLNSSELQKVLSTPFKAFFPAMFFYTFSVFAFTISCFGCSKTDTTENQASKFKRQLTEKNINETEPKITTEINPALDSGSNKQNTGEEKNIRTEELEPSRAIHKTKNLALGIGFDEQLFIDEIIIKDEKVRFNKIEIGNDENIYVQDSIGKILIINPKGEFTRLSENKEIEFEDRKKCTAIFPKYKQYKLGYLTGCKKDIYGNIILSELHGYAIARLLKYNEQGQKIFEVFVNVGKFSGPIDLEVDDFGNIVVANSTYNTLDVYDKNGRFLFSHDGNFKREEVDGISGLNDIAMDNSGNVYAIDSVANQIRKFTLKEPILDKHSNEEANRGIIEKLKNREISDEELHFIVRRFNRTTNIEAIDILINMLGIKVNAQFDNRLRTDLMLSLSSIGKPALPLLIKALENPDLNQKVAILEVLALNNDQSVVLPLENFLKNEPHVPGDYYNWQQYVSDIYHNIEDLSH